MYDLIVIGSGASGIMGSIIARQSKKSVLLLEQHSKIAPKLKATGGGKCNLTNKLDIDSFAENFGKNSRFVLEALKKFDNSTLEQFFHTIGIETHSPDKFRVFPVTHNSQTIIDGLLKYMLDLGIEIKCNQKVTDIILENNIKNIKTNTEQYYCKNILIATGGKGYETLGGSGDGFEFAKKLGHTVTPLYPAMLPLFTKEKWVANCTANTVPKVQIYIDIKKYKKDKITGDLIFTKNGIRGPVVLDFARYITPLFDKYQQIPIKVNLLYGYNEDKLIEYLKHQSHKYHEKTVLEILEKLLAKSIILELANLVGIDPNVRYKNLQGNKKTQFFQILCSTPLTIVGHNGFDSAMVTRGGVNLKQIDPATMSSRLVQGVYFAGEVLDIDGPCGGYNLQWAFSSGYLAGQLSEGVE